MPGLEVVPSRDVVLTHGLLAERASTASRVALPHVLDLCEETGRLRNFDRAAGRRVDAFEGRVYDDSDVYKALEAIPLAVGLVSDDLRRDLLRRYGDWWRRIVAAQDPDGYLNTWFATHPDEPRFADVQWRHELYCLGHLLEAALASAEEVHPDRLFDVARRAFAHVRERFGPGRAMDPPGHPEIELALLRLHRLTGDPEALELARFFLTQRGSPIGREPFGELCQDHQPLREQREIRGHAVRATYLLAAVADLVTLTDDRTWEPALDALWDDLVRRKMYVTGGIGSSATNEGFTEPYDLSNDGAYAETCASIGLVLWAWRMARLKADARYADVMERALCNGLFAGVSLRGDRFFYANPMLSRGEHSRHPWFDTACCPTNLVRFLPGLGRYAYARTESALYVNLYAASLVTLDDADARLFVRTDCPWGGRVHLRFRTSRDLRLQLCLRLPDWSGAASVAVNGEAVPLVAARGYATIERSWSPDDEVELELPMAVERIRADDRVTANRGRVALRRGPLVYCVEGVDHDGSVHDLWLPPDAPLEAVHQPDLLGGVTVLRGEARRADGTAVPLRAIPYYAWANRGPTEMAVWLAESPDAVARSPTNG